VVVTGQAETRPPGLRPTTVIPPDFLMATQVLPLQVTDGITKTNGVNGKAFKSKNQQRRAKLKAKKAEQKGQSVRRVLSPHFPIQRLSFLLCKQEDTTAENPTPVSEEAPNDVEYVFEQLDIKGSGFEEFADVLARFQQPTEATSVRRFSLFCASSDRGPHRCEHFGSYSGR